jgi:hypothetical protein
MLQKRKRNNSVDDVPPPATGSLGGGGGRPDPDDLMRDRLDDSEDHSGQAEQQDKPPKKKRKKDKDGNMLEDVEWIPAKLPFDKIQDEIIHDYEVKHNLSTGPEKKNDFCFFCSNTEDEIHFYQKTKVDELVRFAGTGSNTTSIGRLAIGIHQKYNHDIRGPINKDIELKLKANLSGGRNLSPSEKAKCTPLPDWRPTVIRAHLETHHNDPILTIGLRMKKNIVVSDFIEKNMLVQKATVPLSEVKERIGVNDVVVDIQLEHINSEGVSLEEPMATMYKINMNSWKTLKELQENYIKLGRSLPEKMVPYFSKNRFVTEQSAGHPFVSLFGKKILDDSICPYNF